MNSIQSIGPAFHKKEAICEQLGISERTLDQLVKDKAFPPGVRMGRFLYWSEQAFTSWRAQKFKAQESLRVHE